MFCSRNQLRTCQKVDKDFSKQTWTSRIIQTLKREIKDKMSNCRSERIQIRLEKGCGSIFFNEDSWKR